MSFFPEVSVALSGERFSVAYYITAGSEEIETTALYLAHEQTVELSPKFVPQGDMQEVVGHIESLTYIEGRQYEVVISYPVEVVAGELPQLLNVIFGNASMAGLIRVHRVEIPDVLADMFPGPKFGATGLRNTVRRPSGPLVATVLKPLGYPTEQIVQLAYKLARGGIDIIKDDHGLTNQSFSRYRDRVRRCIKAVRVANQQTGGSSIYVPNVTAPIDRIVNRALYAVQAGAGAIEIVPGLAGLDAVRLLAEDRRINVPILGHPGWFGNLVVSPLHGVTMGAIFGQLYRLAGADISLFPTFGGRFPIAAEDCSHLLDMLSTPMGVIKAGFPVAAGNINIDRVPDLVEFYGQDIGLLVSGGLYASGDNLVHNCQAFRSAVDEAAAN